MSAFYMMPCKSLSDHLQELHVVDSGRPFHVMGTPLSLLLMKSDVPDNVLASATDPNDPGTRFVSELGSPMSTVGKVLVNSFVDSAYRFLWSVRSTSATWSPLNKYGRIGRWAPHTSNLKHKATGVIMSHCGWNLVLEAVSAGVPILARPMIAEQHLNAKLVVDKLAGSG